MQGWARPAGAAGQDDGRVIARALASSRPRELAAARAFAGVFLAALLAFIAVGAALPVLPTYVRGPLGAGNVAVGVVVGSFSLTSVFCRPLAGRLADRRSRRLVLTAGALAMALGGMLYLLADSVPTLVGARLVVGMGEGSLYTAGAAWAVDLAPLERQGFALGLFGLAVWGGLSVGPLAGELLRTSAGYDAVWTLTAALPFAAALIAAALPAPARAVSMGAPPDARSLFPRAARRPGAALALANFGYAALAGFVVLDLRARGVGGGAGVFTAFALAVFASRLVLSRVPDRIGGRAAAGCAAIIEALGLVIIALAGSLSSALVGAVVVGVGFSMLFPALALMVVGEVGAERRGSALGAFTAFFDIGVGLGAPLAGAIAALAGYPAVFLAGAGAALLAAACAALPRPARARSPLLAARGSR
jgi:MFS family permease